MLATKRPVSPTSPSRRSAKSSRPSSTAAPDSPPAAPRPASRRNAKAAVAETGQGTTRGAAPARATATGLPARARRVASDPVLRLREAVLAKLDDLKAREVTVIDVRGRTSVTDYLVIASGTSTRHVKAMADEVVLAAKRLAHPPLGVEGEKESEWILVDLGDLVVHLMLPRAREFYGLERLWQESPRRELGVSA